MLEPPQLVPFDAEEQQFQLHPDNQIYVITPYGEPSQPPEKNSFGHLKGQKKI